LLEQEPGVSNLEVVAESEREPLPATAPLQPKRKRQHPGRQALPANLERVERVISCSPEQSRCAHCGKATEVIGYEQSEQLDLEPAKYFVLVIKREKRGCRCCHRGVVTAPTPARIIEKGLVSDRVVIDTVIAKYCDHLPLYRQSAMFGEGDGPGDQPGYAGRLGDDRGTTADSVDGRNAGRVVGGRIRSGG
jgi:transposase